VVSHQSTVKCVLVLQEWVSEVSSHAQEMWQFCPRKGHLCSKSVLCMSTNTSLNVMHSYVVVRRVYTHNGLKALVKGKGATCAVQLKCTHLHSNDGIAGQ